MMKREPAPGFHPETCLLAGARDIRADKPATENVHVRRVMNPRDIAVSERLGKVVGEDPGAELVLLDLPGDVRGNAGFVEGCEQADAKALDPRVHRADPNHIARCHVCA